MKITITINNVPEEWYRPVQQLLAKSILKEEGHLITITDNYNLDFDDSDPEMLEGFEDIFAWVMAMQAYNDGNKFLNGTEN